jgi:murein DD-endopeptidase MepM/ murein hydrolase activator NlpD
MWHLLALLWTSRRRRGRRPRSTNWTCAPTGALTARCVVTLTLVVALAVPATSTLLVPTHGAAAPPVIATAALPGDTTRAGAGWTWPTGNRVVLRPFEAPSHDYGPGHRGVDLAAEPGRVAVAPEAGEVTFAGPVGGRGVMTIDHGGGVVSTLDSVVPGVGVGTAVSRGTAVGMVAVGHCTAAAPCLHLGVRVDGRYVDPLAFLGSPAWPVLLPLG